MILGCGDDIDMVGDGDIIVGSVAENLGYDIGMWG